MSQEKETGESHYKGCNIEPIEFIEANKMLFAEGCIAKYAARHQDSETPVKDIYDIAVYAYLILKYRYGVGPFIDGRIIPTLKNVPVPGAPVAVSQPVKPIIPPDQPWENRGPEMIEDRSPTIAQWNTLFNLLYKDNRVVSHRDMLHDAIETIATLRQQLLSQRVE
jgi:hypothetical protein